MFGKEFSGLGVSKQLLKLNHLDGLVSKDPDTSKRGYLVHLPDDFQALSQADGENQALEFSQVTEKDSAFSF